MFGDANDWGIFTVSVYTLDFSVSFSEKRRKTLRRSRPIVLQGALRRIRISLPQSLVAKDVASNAVSVPRREFAIGTSLAKSLLCRTRTIIAGDTQLAPLLARGDSDAFLVRDADLPPALATANRFFGPSESPFLLAVRCCLVIAHEHGNQAASSKIARR